MLYRKKEKGNRETEETEKTIYKYEKVIKPRQRTSRFQDEICTDLATLRLCIITFVVFSIDFETASKRPCCEDLRLLPYRRA